jgi:hypothetical protein
MSIPEDERLGLIAIANAGGFRDQQNDPKQNIDAHWAEASLELRLALARCIAQHADAIRQGREVNGHHMAIGFARSLGDVIFDIHAATGVPVISLVEVISSRIGVMNMELANGKAVIRNGQFQRLDRPPRAN